MKKLGMKKVWVPVIALCSVGLVVGTGYAAWTITGGNNKQEETGNRKADTVSDRHIKVTDIAWYEGTVIDEKKKTASPEVCFGWKNEGTTASWLENSTAGYEEKMEFVLTFKVEHGNEVTNYTPAITFKLNDTTDEVVKACTDAKLIELPSTLTAEKIANKEDSYSVAVNFTWGEHFEHKNPLSYYNALKDPNFSDAADSLGKLAKLNSATTDETNKGKPNFTITITVTDNTNYLTK